MAMQKKHSRNSMFFTPQSRKVLSPASRLSLSSSERNPEHLLGNLLKDPIKRALLMEVLSQDKSKEHVNKDLMTWKKPMQQRFKFESPTSLCRRRALEKMRKNSDSSDSINTNHGQSAKRVPFEQILKGVVAYVEIMSNEKDRSAGAKALMRAMGADVKDAITREVTHVVFKDGSFRTYQKAKLLKVHVVSVLWIEAVRKNMHRVPEQKYPALGVDVSDLDTSLICQQFQRDYADVIQDELNRSKNLNIQSKANPRESYSADVIDTSQICDFNSIVSIKNDLKGKQETPESIYLDTTPELTSDSEPEHHSRRRVSTRLFKRRRSSRRNTTKQIAEDDNKKGIEDEVVGKIDKSNETEAQSINLSTLRISTGTNGVNETVTPPHQNVLNYKNVTERKKKPGMNKITILENVIISSPETNEHKDIVKTKIFQDLLVKKIYSDEVENEISPLTVKKRTVRKLYNADDPIILDEVSINVVNRNNNDSNSNSNAIAANVIENNNLKKEILDTPRKSLRLIRKESSESPPKKAKSKNDDGSACSDESNLAKDKGNISKKQTETNTLSDSGEEFEIRPNLTPPKREKSPSKADFPPKSEPKTPKPVKIASTSTASPKKKSKTPSSKPVSDSCDEFVQPDARGNSSNTQKTKKALPKTPARRSARLLSIKSTPENDLPSAQRRSTQDFLPKAHFSQTKSKINQNNTKNRSNQKNRNGKTCSIVCTRFHNPEVQVFQQIVRKLGVFFCEDEVSEKTTHLVAAEPRRTVNLLRAIARGCWVLKSEWLYRSLEAGYWLAEEEYELTEFSVAVQKARQERQAFGPRFSIDIFQNCGSIYISKGSNPRCSDLQELVTLCKGSITSMVQNADIIVGEYVQDKSCATVNWIMDSITFYKRKSLRNYIIEASESD